TGLTPIDRKTLRETSLDEMRRIIQEVEPEKPSARWNALIDGSDPSSSVVEIAAHRKTQPSSLRRLLQGDLDWIVMKGLEKDRARRYETVNGLAMDIARHLSAEPVLAAPPSATYRARRFVRRNRAAVLTVAGIAATLVLGLIGTSWGVWWALNERDMATTQASKADQEAKAAVAARKEAEDRRRETAQ